MRTALLTLASAATLLAGCAAAPSPTASRAEWPAHVGRPSPIEQALACMRSTKALSGIVFVVGPWVDSTGKGNAVAAGATGAFLPQAGTAAFVTDTLRQAGAEVLVNYFGPAEQKVSATYAVNGIFNALDFGNDINADVRVAGVGPTAQAGWAQLTLTIQLDHAKTRLNRQTSVISRAVRYTQMGVSVGRVWGDTLVSGGVQLQDQQRLQFEAVNGPIAMGVIDVLAKEFPSLERCRETDVAMR